MLKYFIVGFSVVLIILAVYIFIVNISKKIKGNDCDGCCGGCKYKEGCSGPKKH